MASISIDEMMSNKNMDPKWMTEANRISDHVPAAKTSKDLPKVEFRVRMCCAKCEEKVREEASEVDGVVSVVTDQNRNKATVFGRTDSMAVLKKLKRHIDKKTTFWPPDQMQQQLLSKPTYGKEASSKEDSMKGKEKRENSKWQNTSDITGTSDRGLKSKQVDSSTNQRSDPQQSVNIPLDGRGEEKPVNLQDQNTVRYGMVVPREMQGRGIEVRAATRPVQQVEFKEMPSYQPTENIERRGPEVRESTPAHQVEVENLRPVEPTRSETMQQVEFKDVVQCNGPARDHSIQSRGFEAKEAAPVHQAEFEKTRPIEHTRSDMPARVDHMLPADSPPDLQRAAPAVYDPAAGNMQRGPAYIREMKMPVIPGELRAAESSREAMLRRPPQYIRVMRPLDPNGMPRTSHHIDSRPEIREMTRAHPAAQSTAHDHHIKADSTQQQQSRSLTQQQLVLEPKKDNNNKTRSSTVQQGINLSGRGPPNLRSQSTIPATAADTVLHHHHHPDYIPVDPRDYMRMNSWQSNIKAVDPRTVDPRELRGGDPADYRPAIDPTRSQLLHFQSSTPAPFPAPPPPRPPTTHSKLDKSSSATRGAQRQPADRPPIKEMIPADTGSDHKSDLHNFSSPDHHVKFYQNADPRLQDHIIPRDYQPEDAFFDDLYMRPSLQLQSFEAAADNHHDDTTRASSPQDDFFRQPITNPNYMKHILY